MIDIPETVRPLWAHLTPPQQRAATLVWLLNQAADPSYKSRYARRWWGMLEERVKLCAMMSADLAHFASTLCGRLDGALGTNATQRADVLTALQGGEDGLVLDALEQETPLILALVRAIQDARRAAWEAGQDAAEPDDTGLDTEPTTDEEALA